MVATLIRLRWRLTINALSRNVWAIVGTVIGTLYGVGLLAVLVTGAIALGVTSPDLIAPALGAAGALTVLAWTLIPLLFTGVDSTLDPRAMAAWVAPSPRLSRGMAVAAACGVTGVLTGLGTLLPPLVWALSGQPGAALLALVLAPVLLATCVLLSRVVVIGAGLSQSRRGRDLVGVISMFLILLVSMLPSALSSVELGDAGALQAAARTAATVASLTPFGWAAAAPGYLARGDVLSAVLLALGSVLFVLVLVPAWDRVVTRVMTGPARSSSRSQAYEATGRRGAGAGARPLVWHERLSRLMPSPAAAVAARALRYWRTDPRYLAQGAALVLVPTVSSIALASGARASAGPEGAQVALGQMLRWGETHPAVFGGVVFAALMCGWALHDDIAFDSTALWQHVSAGTRGRDDRLGRVVGAVLWQLPLIVLVGLVAAGACGRWEMLPAVLGTSLAVLGCAYAWSSVMSVLLPYETIAPGESPMKSRTSGTVFVASLLQFLGVFVVAFLCSPVIGAFAATAVSEQWLWGWALFAGGLLWGLAATWTGVLVGGRYLDQRGARLLATIRSWPGHEETR